MSGGSAPRLVLLYRELGSLACNGSRHCLISNADGYLTLPTLQEAWMAVYNTEDPTMPFYRLKASPSDVEDVSIGLW